MTSCGDAFRIFYLYQVKRITFCQQHLVPRILKVLMVAFRLSGPGAFLCHRKDEFELLFLLS
jgi:hypothetical protein